MQQSQAKSGMLQATKFTVKNVVKQNYFATGDADTFSSDL